MRLRELCKQIVNNNFQLKDIEHEDKELVNAVYKLLLTLPYHQLMEFTQNER